MRLRRLVVLPVVALVFVVLAPAATAWMDHLCVSFGGTELYRSGDADCHTSEGRNLAVAVGEGSLAEVYDGTGNLSLAFAEGEAFAGEGDGNIAVAKNAGTAFAGDGVGNLAVANRGADVFAGWGDSNIAVGDGVDSSAEAGSEGGSGNIAFAKGGGEAIAILGRDNLAVAKSEGVAEASFGDGNSAFAKTGGDAFAGGDRTTSQHGNTAFAEGDSLAIADEGDRNTAIAKQNSEAIAADGNDNTAFAKDNSFACAGGGCAPVCPISTGAGVTCDITGTSATEADHNTAVATHNSDAYAGGPAGNYDWNTAIAAWACTADATFGSNLFEFCGPGHDSNPEP